MVLPIVALSDGELREARKGMHLPDDMEVLSFNAIRVGGVMLRRNSFGEVAQLTGASFWRV
jgi:hypothetical protein